MEYTFVHNRSFYGGVDFTYVPVTRSGGVIPHIWGYAVAPEHVGLPVGNQYGFAPVKLPAKWVVMVVKEYAVKSRINPWTFRPEAAFAPAAVICQVDGPRAEKLIGTEYACGCLHCAECMRQSYAYLWPREVSGVVAMHWTHAVLCAGFNRAPRGTGISNQVNVYNTKG